MSPAPTMTTSPGGGATVTVMVDAPVTPLALAVIDALPTATLVTSPVCETVATALFDEAQVKVADTLAGDAVAVSCTVCPTASVALVGETLIDLIFGPPFANSAAVGAVAVGC